MCLDGYFRVLAEGGGGLFPFILGLGIEGGDGTCEAILPPTPLPFLEDALSVSGLVHCRPSRRLVFLRGSRGGGSVEEAIDERADGWMNCYYHHY